MLLWAASHQLAAIRFISLFVLICSVQFSPFSGVHLFATPWIAACQASQHHQLSELTQAHVHWVRDAIEPSDPLLSLSTPSIFPRFRVFSSESVICIRWPKYWSLSFSVSPFNECSGLISFRIDWLDLLAVQGTLLLQHHSSKASILWFSHPSLWSNSHTHTWLLGKPELWLYGPWSALV